MIIIKKEFTTMILHLAEPERKDRKSKNKNKKQYNNVTNTFNCNNIWVRPNK